MGRHREFSTEEALDAAVDTFWAHGYEGTSMADLTEATGVAAPGLYKAFGNKEELFFKAVARYEARYLGFMKDALEAPTARRVIELLLRENAKVLARRGGPAGCLGVNGAIACSEDAEPVRAVLVKGRRQSEAALARRLKRAEADGQLPKGVAPEDLARYVMTVSQGLAVQAKSGAGLRQLERVIDLAMLGMPVR